MPKSCQWKIGRFWCGGYNVSKNEATRRENFPGGSVLPFSVGSDASVDHPGVVRILRVVGDLFHPDLDLSTTVEEEYCVSFLRQEVVIGGFRPAESTSLEGTELSPGGEKPDFRRHSSHLLVA